MTGLSGHSPELPTATSADPNELLLCMLLRCSQSWHPAVLTGAPGVCAQPNPAAEGKRRTGTVHDNTQWKVDEGEESKVYIFNAKLRLSD